MLRNAVRLTKEGGIVVYSTCSFDPSQNEEVVERVLKEQAGRLELLDALEGQHCAVAWRPGHLRETIRLSPLVSRCGGMFIAKLRKLPFKPVVNDSEA